MSSASPSRSSSHWNLVKQSGQIPVFKVVLTGGPCGGKTTASSMISDHMQKLGWRVFRVPEAATLIFSGGVTFGGSTAEQQFEINSHILKVMMSLEDSFYALARSTGMRSIVLCDRGAMDVRAYMPEDQWEELLRRNDFNNIQLRDGRYDCIIHLQTAADGAVQFYTLGNNQVRTETPDMACALDHRIKQNWMGHPHLYVADNRKDFKSKIDRVLQCICNFVGEPEQLLSKRKFLVTSVPSIFPVEYHDFVVEHDYLVSAGDVQLRLRKRGQDGTGAVLLACLDRKYV